MAEYDKKRNIKEKIQASFPERPVQGIKQMILSYETIQDDLIFPRVLISLFLLAITVNPALYNVLARN